MRSWSRAIVIAGVATLSLGGKAPTLMAQSAPALVYPPSDPARDIAAALAAAAKDGKHVLLDFGADWCPDCRVLGAVFEDPAVAPFAAANFHIVHIDVGRRDKNGDVAVKYQATSEEWIPAVVVLDPGGKTVALTDGNVRLTRRTTPEQLLALLKEWAPKKLWVELSSFTERGVGVKLTLSGIPLAIRGWQERSRPWTPRRMSTARMCHSTASMDWAGRRGSNWRRAPGREHEAPPSPIVRSSSTASKS